ncbi:hypothetical protein ACSFB8_07485 [Enterococcus faecalis]
MIKKPIVLLIMVGTLLSFTGCKIEYKSPQSARDDNYGIGSSVTENSNDSEVIKKTGKSDKVYTNLALKKGSSVLDIKFTGGSNIMIRIFDNDGTLITTFSKKVATYNGQQVVQVPKDGDNYLLEIKSDGEWEIELTSTTLK